MVTSLTGSSFAHANNFDDVIAKFDAAHGGNLASAPKIKPDGKFYYLNGKIQVPDDETAGFLANVGPTEANDLLANALRRSRGMGESTDYFGVALPPEMENYYFDNAQIGAGFDMVGRYVANIEYSTVSGRKMQAPVFQAIHFELWSKRPDDNHAASMSNSASEYEQCMNDSGGNMVAMQECSAAEYTRQDVRLNLAYKAAMAKVSDKNSLRNQQREWIKKRDSECTLEEDGGQAAMLNLSECVLQITSQRADELESMI